MQDKTSALQFPCEYPIKVFGLTDGNVEQEIIKIVRECVHDFSEDSIAKRFSKDGKYLALTVKITAISQQQLDDIYRALTANEHVMMAL